MDDAWPPNVIPFPSRPRAGAARRSTPDERLITRSERPASMLVAELRGWRTMIEALGPVRAEAALAGTVDRAVGVLAGLEVTEVALDGEPMQPIVSVTFEGPGHALRALRAADLMREEVSAAQAPAPPGRQYQLCAGINSASIAEMALGEDETVSLQSVGTLRSFATRLQEFAGPGQILLAAETVRELGGVAIVRSVGEIRMNAQGERQEAFLLVELSAPRVGDPAR